MSNRSSSKKAAVRTNKEILGFLDYLSYLAHNIRVGKAQITDEERAALAALNGAIAQKHEWNPKRKK